MSTVTIFCREGACNVENHTRDNCPNRAAATSRTCLNCQGTGERSWPQSRNTDPRNPLVRERLAPQVTKCYACNGTGQVSA